MTNNNPSVMIQANNLSKNFSGMHALKGASLSVERGEVVCLIGPSGSGKSTFLRCIHGLEKPDGGEVYLEGKLLDPKNKEEYRALRNKMGFVFQHFNLFPNLTVLENCTFAQMQVLKRTQEEATENALSYLGKVGLLEKKDSYPNNLSGGQKQRVAIARALSNNPKVLLSDEATSALDPDATESILKLLRNLNKRLGITIILITHEMSVIKSIANRVAVMENGKVVEEGDVYDIFANPKEEITKKFINSSSALSNITKLIENKTIIPADSKLVKLTFTRDSVGNATISKISREYNVDVNIMLANVDVVNADALGGIIASIEGTKENVQRAIDFLHESNVKVEVIHHA